MTVATRADAPHFEVDAYSFHPLAVPSRGSKELAIWALSAGPGAFSPAHHHDREVVFVVNSGRMAATIGGADVAAGPGDAIIVPAQATFELRNASDTEPASLTVTTTVGMQATMGGNTFPPPWSV
jgi:mannose-6-phosphate isomerase-like protein (cupin superfamily)